VRSVQRGAVFVGRVEGRHHDQQQMGSGGKRHQPSGDKKSEEKKPLVDEKAYKAALKKIRSPRQNTILGE
jgi:hypothetical protein